MNRFMDIRAGMTQLFLKTIINITRETRLCQTKAGILADMRAAATRSRVSVLANLALLLCAAHGCKRDGAIDGFAKWRFGVTTVKDGVSCVPRKSGLTYCSQNGPVTIAEQTASVDLYFRGTSDDAPLTEILLAITHCRPDPVGKALVTKLGEANEKKQTKLFWRGEKAVIVAELPGEEDECLIHFVEPGDHARIGELEK
jgi:hypothetical protein